MIFIFYYGLILLFATAHATQSARRIASGKEITDPKPYVVYFLKAPKSPVNYTGWTCAGAIVTEWFILTAASCVEDIQYMYAIAGYSKFVPEQEIEMNECTKHKKKKVVLTCVPKGYKLSYNKVDEWSNIDIAVVKVESAYDFTDVTYQRICSYIPEPIDINYEPRYQQPGLDAIVMGWGHSQTWRKLTDKSTYNAPDLRYASTRIMDKAECKKYYDEVKGMGKVIDNYMICTLEQGNLDDVGEVIERSAPVATGCLSKVEKLMGMVGTQCELSSSEIIAVRAGIDADEAAMSAVNLRRDTRDGKIKYNKIRNETKIDYKRKDTRRQDDPLSSGQEGQEGHIPQPDYIEDIPTVAAIEIPQIPNDAVTSDGTGFIWVAPTNPDEEEEVDISYNEEDAKIPGKEEEEEEKVPKTTRILPRDHTSKKAEKTPGLCQNDHGAPLVSWIGTHEVLLGIGSVFKIDTTLHCVGPYLFTSTQCNGRFLECILNMYTNNTSLRRRCDKMLRDDGIEVIERRLSWIGHPAGPADNEVIQERHQRPLHNYHGG